MSRSVVVVGSHAPALVGFRGPLLAAMAARGHRVVACAPRATPEIIKTLRGWGVEYHHLPFVRGSLAPGADLASVAALYQLLRARGPDLLLSFTIKPVVLGSLVAERAGIRQICSMITGLGYAFTEGTELQRRLVGLAAHKLYRLALSRSSHVIFQNPDDRELFARRGLLGHAASIVVDGSGVDLEHYADQPASNEPRFLMISRLIREKGVREFVEAARLLQVRHPQVRCQLAGWIDETAPCPIRAEDIEGWVRAGLIEHLGPLKDVRPALAGCSAYVLPSYYREGIPRTILEAMATGRPVITTDMPGCREAVADGVNGFLVPPRDPVALAGAMRRMVEEPDLTHALGRASRRIAESRYGVERVNQTILDFLGL